MTIMWNILSTINTHYFEVQFRTVLLNIIDSSSLASIVDHYTPPSPNNNVFITIFNITGS